MWNFIYAYFPIGKVIAEEEVGVDKRFGHLIDRHSLISLKQNIVKDRFSKLLKGFSALC